MKAPQRSARKGSLSRYQKPAVGWWVPAVLCAVGLAVRVAAFLTLSPEHTNLSDHMDFFLWARAADRDGLRSLHHLTEEQRTYPCEHGVHLCTPFTYGPLAGAMLKGMGAGIRSLGGADDAHGRAGTACIQMPTVLVETGLIALMWIIVRGAGGSVLAAGLAAAMIALSPGLILNSAVWGQWEGWLLLPLTAGVWCLTRGRPVWGTVWFLSAWFIKTGTVLFAPVLAVGLLVQPNRRRALGLSAGVAALLLLAWVFVYGVAGTQAWLRQATVGAVDFYDAPTKGAYNFWWLVTGYVEGEIKPSRPVAGPLSLGTISRVIVLALWAGGAVLLWRSLTRRPGLLWLYGVWVGLSAYVWLTGMHERYITYTLTFASLAWALRAGAGVWLVAAIQLAIWFNHAPIIKLSLADLWEAWGGQLGGSPMLAELDRGAALALALAAFVAVGMGLPSSRRAGTRSAASRFLRPAVPLVAGLVGFLLCRPLLADLLSRKQNLRGFDLVKQEKFSEALPHFEIAVRLKPEDAAARINLANTLREEKRDEEAIHHYREALRVQPDQPGAYVNLGLLLRQEGRYGEAIEELREGRRMNPESPEIAERLAWLLATVPQDNLRDGEQAVALGEWASRQANDRDPRILLVLAAAYAEAGRFADAVHTCERARQIADGLGQEPMSQSAAALGRTFGSGRAYRLPALVRKDR